MPVRDNLLEWNLPTTTTPDGVVHLDVNILRQMNPELREVQIMTPQQREVFDAFREAYRPDIRAIGADAAPSPAPAPVPLDAPSIQRAEPQFLPPAPILPAPPGDASGKPGTDEDSIYALFGRLANDGQAIVLPDGSTTTDLPQNWAYDPATRDIYYIPTPALDRATFIPLAKRAGGGIEIAMPMAIQGALDAIDRAVERQRRGLIVPNETLNREAIEVAGMASSGSFGASRFIPDQGTRPSLAVAAGRAIRRIIGRTQEIASEPVTPLAPGFQLGTAGLGSPITPSKPPRPVLDAAGFYSQAEKAALEVLPPRSQGENMLALLTRQGRVAEAEVRDMNLDVFLLGDEAATARRAISKAENDIAGYQQRMQEAVQQRGGSGVVLPRPVNQRIISVLEDRINLSRQIIAQENAKLKQLRMTKPSPQVSREAIAEYAREHRIRLAETVYETPQYDPAILQAISLVESGLQRFPVTLARTLAQRARVSHSEAVGALGTVLNTLTREGLTPLGMRQALDSLAIEYPELLPYMRHEITQAAGRPVDELTVIPTGNRPTTYSESTIDPKNPTNKEIVLRIDAPAAQEAMRILDSMPRFDARVIAWMEGQTVDDMRRIGISRNEIPMILDARSRHPREVARLRALAQQGAWLGGHFADPAWTGMAMTSVQELTDGRIALFLNQLQSDWTNALNASPARTTTKNVIVSNLTRWVDPMMRRVLREAVESGADVVIVPNGATVKRYNDLPDSIQRLYNQIYPRRMASVMREIDSTVPKAGRIIQGSEMNRTPLPGNVPRQALSGPLGQMFEITPAIRNHFQQGGGTRLLSGSGDDPLASVAIGVATESVRRRNRAAPVNIESIAVDAPHPRRPVIAYHGTETWDNFSTFDLARSNDIGIHFGTRVHANIFARDFGAPVTSHRGRAGTAGARVFPVELNLRNPLDLPDMGTWDVNRMLGEIVAAVPRNKHRVLGEILGAWEKTGVVRNYGSEYQPEWQFWSPTRGEYEHLRQLIDDLGYDSIRYRNGAEADGWSYIVWKRGQVRSATDRSHQLFSGAPAPVGMENQDGAAPTAD